MSRSRHIFAASLTALALIAVTCLAYAPAFSAGFIWDDPDYVVENLALRDFRGLFDIWTNIRSVPQWYPMVFTSFWIEFQFFGLNASAYHTTNILLHAFTAVILWRLLVYMNVPAATLCAFLFALHPVHVESVAWITERKNTLSGLFYFSAMMVYLKWAGVFASADLVRKPKKIVYFIALLLFACAALSKTVAGSLPAAILLVVYWKRGKITLRDVLPLLPMFALAIVLGLTTAHLEKTHVGAVGPEWDYAPTMFGEFVHRTLIAGRAWWFYAITIVWPFDLAFIYPRWHIDRSAVWQYAFPIGALVVVIALVLLRNRIGRGPIVCVLFFSGTLFPALGYFNVYPHRYSFVADHFQHLASTGLLVLLAAGVTAGWTRLRQLTNLGRDDSIGGFKSRLIQTLPAVLLCIFLGVLTLLQSQIYKNVQTLWSDTLKKNPDSWMANVNMGHAMVAKRPPDLGRAEDHYRRGLELFENEETLTNVASILGQRGNYEQAAEYARRAVERNPKYLLALNAYGKIFLNQGDSTAAAEQFLRVIEIRPEESESNMMLGTIYRSRQMPEIAVEHLRIAATGASEDPQVRLELAQALLEWWAKTKQPRLQNEAIFNIRSAISIRPDDAASWTLLGVALFDTGDTQGAREALERALMIDPNSALARAALDSALARSALEKVTPRP